MRRLILLVAVLGVSASPRLVGAQVLERSPATGNFLLTYTDLDGITQTVSVDAADRIDPAVAVVVTSTGPEFEYRYEIENRATAQSRAAVSWLDVPCPVGRVPVQTSAPVAWYAVTDTLAGLEVCHFKATELLLTPGEAVDDLTVRTTWLPGIGKVRVAGFVDFVPWPSEEGAVPESAFELASQVQGLVGGWVERAAVVPVRAPDSFESPADALREVTSDLGGACALGWISNQGVCHSLEVKLDQASKALGRGQADAARGQLRSFSQELQAQRGRHVDGNAYALLAANVAYLILRL